MRRLLGAGLSVIALGAFAAPAHAATVVVDGDDVASDADGCGGGPTTAADPCGTIQSGIDHANPGDTVELRVKNGTAYQESVTVNKANLSVLGPQATVDPAARPFDPQPTTEVVLEGPDGSAPAITIAAGGVRVAGFVARGVQGAPGIRVSGLDTQVDHMIVRDNSTGVRLSTGSTAVIDSNGIYENNAPGPFGETGHGVVADFPYPGDQQISSNAFVDNQAFGVGIGGHSLDVVGNTIEGSATALFLDDAESVLVQDNLVDGAGGTGMWVQSTTNIEISENDITGWATAIRFARSFGQQNAGVQVIGNDIHDNQQGIVDQEDSLSVSLPNVVRANRIVGNLQAILHTEPISSTLNAENNFFGCNEGPAGNLCNDVGAGVDTTPWLVLRATPVPATLPAPGMAAVIFDVTRNSAGQTVDSSAFPPTTLSLTRSGVGSLVANEAVLAGGVGVGLVSSSQSGTSTVRATMDFAGASADVRFASAAPNVINGTPGNDTLTGTSGDDIINCGAGNDVVDGRGGNDVIRCGSGNDRVDGGDGSDTISGEGGADRLLGGAGNDSIGGGSGNDTIGGQGGNDALVGNTGRDRINGESGNDRISGDSGDDRVSGGSGRDRADGVGGNDRVSGGSGNDRVSGGSGNDRLAGDGGRDRLSGGTGRDRLSGGSGNDRLDGGSGNDSLFGGPGRDRLIGGPGRDRTRP